MDNLFAHLPPSPSSLTGDELIAAVAVEQAVDRELSYLVPARLRDQIAVGQRVRVPLGRGNHNRFAYVVGLSNSSDYAREKMKQLHTIDDSRALLRPKLLELARWMSRYYVTPLGTVLESVVPSAVKKRTGIGHITLAHPILTHQQMHDLIAQKPRGKTAAVLGAMLQLSDNEPIDIVRLAAAANARVATVRKMAKTGLLRLTRETDFGLPESPAGEVFVAEAPLALNAEQQKAFEVIQSQLSTPGFRLALLHGVTGSGKTEVYLHAIERIVAEGKQAIVLVPEIALTPQTALRFTRRFPQVAVMHSGLSATDRHSEWRLIAAGRAQVVVGARSAVFAPLPNLGLIVVDEEHESSYKQETAPRYHARDVAIKRGQLENVPVLLGSATPSLESYCRIRAAAEKCGGNGPPSHAYLHIAGRATAQQLPKVTLVDMKTANIGRPGIHLFSPQLEAALHKTLDAGNQAILLLNRRGYASYIWCASCKNVVTCKYCDVGMVYHRTKDQRMHSGRTDLAVQSGQLHCHYCLAVNALPAACPDCGKKLSLFGLGTQRVEEELETKFPGLTFARMDSDTMRSAHDYDRVLSEFGQRKIQLLMGTQMIAKGLDFPNVTLVGVISGDTALMLPDFRSAERTFQIITQVAGRAGRGEKPGTVILQTFLPDDATIRAAISQDYLGFARRELALRQKAAMPPYLRMARIVLRDVEEQRLNKLSLAINEHLRSAAAAFPDVRIEGPMPCHIARIAGYFRNQLVLASPRAASLQQVLAVLRKSGDIMKGDRIALDVDPVSLL